VDEITDDFMRERLATTRSYTAVLLRPTPRRREPGADAVVWEHGRRNFALRAEGVLAIVCPVTEEAEVSGIGIFTAPVEEVVRIMEGDPAVIAGLFTYQVLPVRSFPGDSLPG